MAYEAYAPNPNDPAQRLWAEAWNDAHSVGAALAGIRVAIFVPDVASFVEHRDGPVLLFSVLAGRLRRRRTSEQDLARSLVPGRHTDVVLARRDAGPAIDRLLRDRLGYHRDLTGQVAGHWFGPNRPLPAEPPGYLESTAVLPPAGITSLTAEPLLVLAPIDSEWRPIVAEAVYTFSFSEGIDRGEVWRFIPTNERWPTPYRASLAEPVSAPAARTLFTTAAHRLRADASVRYMRVSLTRDT